MTGRRIGGFDESDLTAIREAVDRAEKGSHGEIVACIVERLDAYPESRWRGALIGALLVSVVAAIMHARLGGWGFDPWLGATIPAVLGALAGYAVAHAPAVERLLADRARMDRMATARAEAAFLEEGVFRTERATGVLLFLALAERRAVVLADAGIHAVVPEGRWSELVHILTDGMRSGDARGAVIGAVEACGQILRETMPLPGESESGLDRDELDDRARVQRVGDDHQDHP